MSLILNIDTSSANAYVFLADGEQLLMAEQNTEQKNHASFLEPAIQRLFKAAGLSMKQLDAVAVVSGPGSYTGLRVGVATAKGLCYALQKPLIFLNTLELMAKAGKETNSGKTVFYCPMIDARRMEVFTALYDFSLKLIEEPQALILTETSFEAYLKDNIIIFSGDGSTKFKTICKAENAVFSPVNYGVKQILEASVELYSKNKFEDLAYSEPFYLKEFFSNFKIK